MTLDLLTQLPNAELAKLIEDGKITADTTHDEAEKLVSECKWRLEREWHQSVAQLPGAPDPHNWQERGVYRDAWDEAWGRGLRTRDARDEAGREAVLAYRRDHPPEPAAEDPGASQAEDPGVSPVVERENSPPVVVQMDHEPAEDTPVPAGVTIPESGEARELASMAPLLKAENTSLRRNHGEVMAEVVRLRTENESLKAENKTLQGKIANLENTVIVQAAEIERLRSSSSYSSPPANGERPCCGSPDPARGDSGTGWQCANCGSELDEGTAQRITGNSGNARGRRR